MHASVRALLTGILDYAGFFPPAKLPLDEALRNYIHYRKESPYSWMLGRFVCPTGRLQELVTLACSHPEGYRLSLTVLGRRAPDWNEFYANLEADLDAIERFRLGWGTDAVIDTIEVPLPENGDVDAIADNLSLAATHMVEAKLRGFLEIAISPQWSVNVEKIAAGLYSLHNSWEPDLLGLKLRCGGLTADAFPSNEQVAFFITQCNESESPWKATAGLHHARRHFDKSLQVWHYGFLNVFVAGVFAREKALTETELIAILADRDGTQIRFEDERISWGESSCMANQIRGGRTNFATSFGCCSFEEPVEELLAMGLLDRA